MPTEPSQEKIEATRLKGYRPDVVLCVIHNEKLLLAYKAEHQLWQIPQGGIRLEETIEEAVRRELTEEMGETLAASYKDEYQYLGEDFITFHPKVVEEKNRFLDVEETIQMKGKHYFLYAVMVESDEFNIEESEFDELQWTTDAQAVEIAKTIYQAKKKQLTLNTIRTLRYKAIIK